MDGRINEIEAFCAQLRRDPDFTAPELQAYDAADLLLLQHLDELADDIDLTQPGALVVVGDRHGALTLGAIALLGAAGVRSYQDPLLHERALATNAARLGLTGKYESVDQLGQSLLAGASVVLLQLPKSLSELREIAWHIACWAPAHVSVLAGGRDKHMSRAMNEVLARYVGEVRVSRGWRKARVLSARAASEPGAPVILRERSESQDPPFPVHASDPDLQFELYAFGATFGGARLDHGSRLLLRTLREQPPSTPKKVFDLGCGNGVLAVAAAQTWPDASVVASDQSIAAVRASRLTAQHAGVDARVAVHRADAAEAIPDGWADLVLLNPPFHTGATVHSGVGHRLVSLCARALAPGGELRLVFNSHLSYRELVEREFGPTRQLARNKTFTVLAATRRG